MINIFSEDLVVIRPTTEGAYVLGKFVPSKSTNLKIKATIEPMNAQTLLLLPEGERVKESIRIYTDVELFTVDSLKTKRADVVCYRGREYEVQMVKHWTTLIPHFAVVAVLKNTKVGD